MRFRQNPLPAERFLEGPAAPPPGAGQSLDVLKALAQRRTRAPELQQAHHARVEYEAGWRRTAEMAMLRAERESAYESCWTSRAYDTQWCYGRDTRTSRSGWASAQGPASTRAEPRTSRSGWAGIMLK